MPLLSNLCKLLNDDTIIEEIDTCSKRVHTNGLIEDFCDGSIYNSHLLFSQDSTALQIVAYYDELEICNPLGSHIKKHKWGIVFYTLANISPDLRSQLKMINLAIVASVPIIEKHGLDKILQPILVDLNILSTTGISLPVHGIVHTFKGALIAFLGDNFASNDLGGFKKSFSFSFRCCRTCFVTQDTLTSSFLSEAFNKREDKTHDAQCKQLDDPTGAHYSKAYGINRRSSLMDVTFYSMFGGGLPHYAIHDILEGVAQLEIKLLLAKYTRNKLIHLDELNDRLMNFNFGYTETDEPIQILSHTLQSESSLRASASQMLQLVRILPFLIGYKIPEDNENWLCFLLLRKIVDIVLSPILNEDIRISLKLFIEEHHKKFIVLYGSEAFPKMHFMLHYPEQITAVGPMVRTWTFRHEAKLNFLNKHHIY